MRKFVLSAFLALAAFPALAHPVGIPYASRGECEAAYAEFSKLDRERLTQMGFTPGEAQRTFRDLFRCQFDPNSGLWFIVLIDES